MIRIYTNEYKSLVNDVIANTLRYFNEDAKRIDVEIEFVSKEEIQEINKEERNIDKVTDVLSFQNIEDISFPLELEKFSDEINPEDNTLMLGEIYICLDVAKEQANEFGHSIEREIAFLTCHGMLHLLGFDHDTKAKEEEMMSITEEILSKVNLSKNDLNNQIEPENKDDFKSGYVTIMGRPNAGKSTFINTLIGEKVAIVSWRPQTTRENIIGIYNEPNCQIVFTDTPGIFTPRNKLGNFMVKNIELSSEHTDVILYILNAEKDFNEVDKQSIENFINKNYNIIVAINKVDRVTKDKVVSFMAELNKYPQIKSVVPISALKNKNVSIVLDEIKKLLTDNIKYYEDDLYTDKTVRYMCGEIIREKAFRLLDKEIPYGIGVEIIEFDEKESGKLINISADIICEKQAHKKIILGKNGQMIKQIATYSRQDMENLLGTKVFLTLFVKVEPDWRENLSILKDLGYDMKKLK
ncbi:MAG: GTPase Era [Clostridia bacterium]|nr:GTPase Era [Clostridia bacterium]